MPYNYREVLNDRQFEAMQITDKPVLVLAGAGSGKTRVITYKLAYLIKNMGLAPWQILALTFTNKAADEMKTRVSGILNREESFIRKMWVSTFHSSCARILRYEGQKLGLDNNFTIYDTDDSKKLIKDIMKSLSVSISKTPAEILQAISWRKNKPYPEPSDFVNSDYQEKLLDIWQEYEKRLMAQNAIDFDNIILKAIELFAHHPDTLKHYQNIFQYILVDEFQDTNDAQYELIRLINGERHSITVVGDDDQSVYGFRGAQVANVSRFVNDFTHCEVVRLEQNYRSTQVILKAANSVIDKNSGRIGKTLWTENHEGDKIELLQAEDERMEGQLVVDNIRNHFSPDSSYAIFYRMNFQSRVFEELLKQSRIQYQIFGTVKFYERREIKDTLAYLYLLVNERDDTNLLRIINVPRRGIGDKTIQEIIHLSNELLLPLYSTIKYAVTNNMLSVKIAQKMKEFTGLIDELRSRMESISPYDLVDAVLQKTGYLDYLQKEEDGEERKSNVTAFMNGVTEHIRRYGDEADIRNFLNEISLYTDIDNLDKNNAKVYLMTVHNAKGLEFDKVYITGLEENIFPHFRSANDRKDLEEERRLFYVALTRAKKNVMLSHTQARTQYGSYFYNPPSRFLNELDSEVVEYYLPNKKNSGSLTKPVKGKASFKEKLTGLNILESKGFTPLTAQDIELGDILRHDTFGEGEVTYKKSENQIDMIKLRFSKSSEKVFILKFTKLTKVRSSDE